MRIDSLSSYMQERQTVFLKKTAGEPWPWTKDPILQEWSFCNVFREDDTVTIWIRENIREPYADHPNLWFMLAIARTINWPPALQRLIDGGERTWPLNANWCPLAAADVIDGMVAHNEKAYTGAYMIRAESDPNKPWYYWTKAQYIFKIVLGRLWEDYPSLTEVIENATTLEEMWRAISTNSRYVGWGPFMTYEVVTDLRHTRYGRDATDIYTWANAGPGALRGLNRIHGRPLKQSVRKPVTEMRELLLEVQDEWPDDWPKLEMRDIEHSLCEYDKYLRTREGGRPRAKYRRR